MDSLKNLVGGGNNTQSHSTTGETGTGATASGSSSGGFMGKLNEMAGGGKKSEKNEDSLDKGVDWVQENVLGQGPQNNESAIEQAKDEQISDFIRGQYKGSTGKEFPVADK